MALCNLKCLAESYLEPYVIVNNIHSSLICNIFVSIYVKSIIKDIRNWRTKSIQARQKKYLVDPLDSIHTTTPSSKTAKDVRVLKTPSMHSPVVCRADRCSRQHIPHQVMPDRRTEDNGSGTSIRLSLLRGYTTSGTRRRTVWDDISWQCHAQYITFRAVSTHGTAHTGHRF